MQLKRISFILTAITMLLLYGFSAKKGGFSDLPSGDTINGLITGEDLFLKNCAACHDIDRKGNPPVFPSLVSVNERLEKDSIFRLLQTGRNIMPSFAHLSQSEKIAIVGFLFGEETESEMITYLSPEEVGKNLFVANCSRCHKTEQNDISPADQKSCGIQPAVLGGISEKYDLESFEYIVNTGPCYMPSFAHMAQEDKTAIYTYLKSFEDKSAGITENSRRRGCGMIRCGR